jgi:hypothetical protein
MGKMKSDKLTMTEDVQVKNGSYIQYTHTYSSTYMQCMQEGDVKWFFHKITPRTMYIVMYAYISLYLVVFFFFFLYMCCNLLWERFSRSTSRILMWFWDKWLRVCYLSNRDLIVVPRSRSLKTAAQMGCKRMLPLMNFLPIYKRELYGGLGWVVFD